MVSAAKSITVGVSDLEASLKLFRDSMQLVEERRYAASPELANAWGLAPGTQADLVELSCRGYGYGKLRLAQFTPTPATKVRVDFGPGAIDGPLDTGPKAIDFYVADPIADSLARIEGCGYRFRSPPHRHVIGGSVSEEVVFSGPDDVPVLLMVGHRHRPTSLRAGSPDGPFSEIATVSVISGDLDASRRFYSDGLKLVAVNDAETMAENRDLVCELVDAPRGTRVHFVLYAEPGEASGKILLLQFIDVERKRLTGRMRPGHLGFSLLTVEAANLDAAMHSAIAAGGTLVTPPTAVPVGDRTVRLALLRGPNEEMFEIVEA